MKLPENYIKHGDFQNKIKKFSENQEKGIVKESQNPSENVLIIVKKTVDWFNFYIQNRFMLVLDHKMISTIILAFGNWSQNHYNK